MLKQLIPLVLLFASMTASAQEASLNGIWQFQTDQYRQGEAQQWYAPQHNTAGWDSLHVPGNWDIENEYADYAGTAWYRTTFNTKSDWKDQRVRLYFESVYNDATVWLNGKKIVENHLGFLPFWADIQEVLVAEGENVLVVEVDNVFKRGAIWNWGGIRRPVWLEVTPMTRLEQQHITALPDLQKGTAAIDVKFIMSNAAPQPQRVDYRLIIAKDGQTVYEAASPRPIEIPARGEQEESVSFVLGKDQVTLWHFNHPELYTARLELKQYGNTTHQLTDRFGIRKVEIDGYDFKLNGETVRTVGFNLVPEDRTTGNTLPLWRIKEDVDMMKQLGANMARLSHLPLPKAFLDYLDEKGIMTFEEVSLWGKDVMVDPEHPTPKEWLARMVALKYNHPSVIGWSIGNEIGNLGDNPKVMAYVESAVNHAHKLDPTRLAIYVTHSAQKQEKDPVVFSDMILFNTYGWWGHNVDEVNRLHPGKPIFYSEIGKNLNNEDPNKSKVYIQAMLDSIRGREHVMGASVWTFNDYRSFWQAHPEWTTPPSQNRTWGLVNTFRQKKKSYWDFRQEYAPVAKLTVGMTDNGQAQATIVPRGKLDIPAYPLRGYRLVWAAYDSAGKVADGSFKTLLKVTPGDEAFDVPLRWSADGVVRLEVHLLDPQDYDVLDTTLHFQRPSAPDIIKVNTAKNTARIILQPTDNTTSYQVRYRTRGGEWQLTAPTINPFVEISDLKEFTTYDFTVIANNGAGQSVPSPSVEAATDEDELPPTIWKTEAANGAFFVGYSVDKLDYLYEVALGTQSGHYTDTLTIQNVGVLKIPNLENGKTYYYKMRVRKQWGFASEWSHEMAITPDAGGTKGKTEIKGVLTNGKKSIVLYEPVPKAIGYTLNVGSDKFIEISSAKNSFKTLSGIVKEEDILIEMK